MDYCIKIWLLLLLVGCQNQAPIATDQRVEVVQTKIEDQVDPYQRVKVAELEIDDKEAKAIYYQLVLAIEAKDHLKVKALKGVIIDQYPNSIYAQRLKQEGEGSLVGVAGLGVLFLMLSKIQLAGQ